MNVSKSISMAALSLTVLAAAPDVSAHNQAKYMGIPFGLPVACPNLAPGASAKFVSSGGTTKLQLTGNNTGEAGLVVYASNPGSPGRSSTFPPTPAQTIPEGTLTFNYSGLPAGSTLFADAEYSDSNSGVSSPVTANNGFASVTFNTPSVTPGSPVVFFDVGADTPSAAFSTFYFYNFRYNNQPLLLDTTLSLNLCVP